MVPAPEPASAPNPSAPTEPEPERQLPIDIDYAKFLNWLVDRRRVPRDWHTYLKTARTLARTAYNQTSATARAQLGLPDTLDAHDHVCAHVARRVVQRLNADETLERDMLGRFRDAHARAWNAALAAFDKRDVYLADAAQTLVRAADVDAAALSANAARLRAEGTELARRDTATRRAAAEARARFVAACDQFGLSETEADACMDFDAAVRNYVARETPAVLERAVERIRALGPAVEMYQRYADFAAADGHEVAPVCEAVRKVLSGETSRLTRCVDDEETDDVQGVQESAGVDWGIEVGGSGGATDGDEINWGIEVGADGTAGDGGGAAADGAEIDWGIEVSGSGGDDGIGKGDDGASAGGIDWGIELGGDGDAAGNATGEAADGKEQDEESLTLWRASDRGDVLCDLAELTAFLRRREADGTRGGPAGEAARRALPGGGDGLAELIQQVEDARSASGGAESVRRILALSGGASGARAKQRAARELLAKRGAAERLARGVDDVVARRERIASELGEETPKLAKLRDETRALVEETEQALSKLYGGRAVHILGEINNVFPP